MRKLAALSVVLDGRRVRAGERLTGRVVMKAHTATVVTDVSVHVHGNAKAGSVMETYMDDTIHLLPAESGRLTLIPPAVSSVPFEVEVPGTVPPSFTSRHGRVRYSVRGRVQLEGRDAPDCTDTLEVTVIHEVNLNHLPSVAVRQTATSTGRYKSGLFGTAEQVSVRFVTSRTGFTPKEHVLFAVEVVNDSGVTFDTPSIQLIRTVTLNPSSSTSQTRTESVRSLEFGTETRPYRKILWTAKRFRLPRDLPASFLPHCGVMDAGYSLKVVLPGRRDLSVTLPVVIGTVPLTPLHPEVAERQRRESEPDGHAEPPPAYDVVCSLDTLGGPVSPTQVMCRLDGLGPPGAPGDVTCRLDEDVPGGPPPYSVNDPAGR